MGNCVIKVGADDCPVCAAMSEFDGDVVKSLGLALWHIPLNTVGTYESLRDYLVKNHVDSEGLIDIPIYVLRRDGAYVASVQGEMNGSALKFALQAF
jgi:hypothetical protein